MAAYRRVYDSCHLQADWQEPGSAPELYTLCNRVCATFTFLILVTIHDTIRDAILTCAQKLSLIYRTEPTPKSGKKEKKL